MAALSHSDGAVDHVVALRIYTGAYKSTGKQMRAQFAHLWILARGKVRKLPQYTDTTQFAEAVNRLIITRQSNKSQEVLDDSERSRGVRAGVFPTNSVDLGLHGEPGPSCRSQVGCLRCTTRRAEDRTRSRRSH